MENNRINWALKPHSFFLIFLCLITYLCNLFDLWFTLYVLTFVPNAREVNPFVLRLLEWPLLLVLYKYILPALGLGFMYRNRDKRLARVGIYLCAACFLATVVYQMLSIPRWA